MNPSETEQFAQQIAVALAPLIKFEGTPEEMNQSALAWVSRSRNLAKLWASKKPITLEFPDAPGITAAIAKNVPSSEEAEHEPTLEELGQQAAESEESLKAALPPRRAYRRK